MLLKRKDYIMKKKYVELICDSETQERLTQWCLDLGYNIAMSYDGESIEISKFNFHTTVMYSSNVFSLRNERRKIHPIRAKSIDIQMLGEMKNIPALIVESPRISLLNWKYRCMGLIPTYPIFLPHITVSYDPNSPVYKEKILPDFDLVYDTLNIEDAI